jgi:L-fuconolactonase
MPSTPIIDAHLHLWDPTRFRMRWLDGNDVLDQPFGLAEFREHTQGLEVEGMVYLQVEVEPAYALLEARWALEQARVDTRILGLVPWAPLENGERARAFLDALVALGPLVKGVRRLIQGESRAFCLKTNFVRGVQILPEYGLSFDLCIYQPQLANTIELVRQCPETSFVLDHIGKPNIKVQQLDPWRDELRQLAALPNVCCKLSGLVTEADQQHWTLDDLRPYVEHVVECFGEDRIMFGSDWPVAYQASSYARWVETLDTLTAGLSQKARHKLWNHNARRFYRL